MRAKKLAPVALFVYRRPDHARRTIESLLRCPEVEDSPIHVYADGARSDADAPAVEATRSLVHDLLGSRATYVIRDRNLGLANSVIAGVTELCDQYGRVIVVEDDLLLAPSFLRFLNDGLERYRDEPRVMQVSGHQFDVPSLANSREALFLPMTSSWGWATWKRAWDLFDPAATGWRERLVGDAAKRFDLEGHYPYKVMLARQMTQGLDSWAIRWYYTVFVHDGLALSPPQSLVANIGQDGSGTHGRLRGPGDQRLLAKDPPTLPFEVRSSQAAESVFRAVGRTQRIRLRRVLAVVPSILLGSVGLPRKGRAGWS